MSAMEKSQGVGTHRIRLIKSEDDVGIATVAQLHMELLGFGPLAGLGEYFIREVGYRVNMSDGVLKVALCEVNGEPAGFVAYTSRSISFHRHSLRRHWRRVLWVLALTMLKNPQRLLKLVRVLNVMRSRRGEQRTGSDPMGEVVAVAVRRKFLSPEFVRSTGLRISDELIQHALAALHRTGVDAVRMLVDAANKAALLMYHRLGANFEPYEQAGEPMVQVWFSLPETAKTANGTDIPACWVQKPGSGNGAQPADWAQYWEGLDHRGIFHIEAADYAMRLQRLLPLDSTWRVFEFGCGFGHAAGMLAPKVAEYALWDRSANMRFWARQNVGQHENVRFLDLSVPESTQTSERYDLILVHSVVQYMTEQELQRWLQHWRQMLSPTGRLVISDIVTSRNGFLIDVAALLTFGARRRAFFQVFADGLREIKRYRSMRQSQSLLKLSAPDLARLADSAGLTAQLADGNLSFRPGRLTVVFRAKPIPSHEQEKRTAWRANELSSASTAT